jgi:hypothetical protein
MTERQGDLERCFLELYLRRYGEAPIGAVHGLALALIAGEAEVRVDYPSTWPLSEVVPLLRQAWQEQIKVGTIVTEN